MECASHRISHATWRLQVFSQIFSSTSSPRILIRPISTSSARRNQAHDEAEAQAPSKSKTPPISDSSIQNPIPLSQRLPQSPVITHSRSGTKKKRKARPQPEDNAELQKNPWAVALASPVRMCAATGTRLPRRLMGVYGLVKRPDTQQSYMLPLDLLKDSLQRHSAEGEDESTTAESDTGAGDGIPRADVSPLIARDQRLAGKPTIHILTLRPLMQALTPYLAAKVGKRPGIAKLIPYRWKYPVGPLNSVDLKDCVWKRDMPEYLLRHMRRDIVKKLIKVSEQLEIDRDIVWKDLDLDGISDITLQTALGGLEPSENEACGAVLVFGPKTKDPNRQSPTSNTILHPRTQSTIPVFDLSAYLSEGDIEMLRGSSSTHFQSEAVFFRPNGGREDTDLILCLWKLQRFLSGNS